MEASLRSCPGALMRSLMRLALLGALAALLAACGAVEPQVPMGQATRATLEAMGTVVQRPSSAGEIAPTVNAALRLAYNSYASVAVLIPQRIIGIKSFQEQAAQ